MIGWEAGVCSLSEGGRGGKGSTRRLGRVHDWVRRAHHDSSWARHDSPRHARLLLGSLMRRTRHGAAADSPARRATACLAPSQTQRGRAACRARQPSPPHASRAPSRTAPRSTLPTETRLGRRRRPSPNSVATRGWSPDRRSRRRESRRSRCWRRPRRAWCLRYRR